MCIPGHGHGIDLRQGAQFDFLADPLNVPYGWVDRGTAPASLVMTGAVAA